MAYATFCFSFSTIVTILFSIGSVKVDYYAFINPLTHGFKLYMKACVALPLASSGNYTTRLLNAEMYSCIKPNYSSHHSLSLAIFL